MEIKTDGKCIVCGGEIVGEIIKEFDPKMGPLIIGPGSKQQFHNVDKGFHCKQCGLKYKFVPPKKP